MSDTINPLVSIIITTFNREKIISKTIDSVISQNYINKEIIVVDDCSTDGTKDLLKKYNDKIIYIKLDKNMGVQFASNIGFDNSSGNFLAFVGDDDIWIDKNKLNKQLLVFSKDKKFNIGVVTTSVKILKKNNSFNRFIKKPKNLLEHLLSGNDCVYGSAALIRKEAFVNAGMFDINLKKGTDSDVFRRIVLNGYDFSFINDVTIHYSELEDVRMSNFNTFNINRNIESHLYKLDKYKKKFNELKNAKALVYSYIADNYLLLARYKVPKSLNLSLLFYIKSLKLNFFRIRIFYKILFVSIFLISKKIKNEK